MLLVINALNAKKPGTPALADAPDLKIHLKIKRNKLTVHYLKIYKLNYYNNHYN